MIDDVALNLGWAYGVSLVRNGVVNLSDAHSDRVLFASSNTVVIQDSRENTQTILQGHTQPVRCVCASDDKSVVITADDGPDSLVIAWNTTTALPRATIARPHPNGTLAMDLSPDASLLATLSCPEGSGVVQEIALWDLTAASGATRLVAVPVPAGDLQTMCKFHPTNPGELVSNGVRRVYFWSACLPARAALKYYSPPISSADFKQKIGDFTVSIFIPGSTQAVTGTDQGDVVVWEQQGISAEVGTTAVDRKAVKLMRIHSSPITVLSAIGDFLVTGGEDGFVRFFDPMLRLIAWFERLDAGAVTSVSFSRAPIRAPPPDANDLDVFLCPDFVVGTRAARIVAVDAASFNEASGANRGGVALVDGMLRRISAVAVHPLVPEFTVAGPDGVLQTWDMVTHARTREHTLPDALVPTAATFSRDGAVLLVGTDNGSALLLDGRDFSEVARFKHARAALTHVAVSAKGTHAAAAAADGHVLLFFLVPHRAAFRWEYVGRCKAHYSPVVAVSFGEAPSGQTRCFSVSDDGRMCEYDLQASSLVAGVVVCGENAVCEGSTPTALCFTPPLPYYEQGVIDTQVVLADASFKLRIFNPDSGMTTGTFRGPTFGGALTQLDIFQAAGSTRKYIAFRSKERTAGVMLWPVDGDPAKMMGMIAHAGAITGMAVSCDGRKLITAGADGVVNQWDVHTHILENVADAADQVPNRWEAIIADPSLIEDIKRYFVFAQIRAQGEDSTQPRDVPGRVLLDHIPELMCALGYYPTQAEIHDMLSNLAYTAAVQKQPKPEDVDLATFLYLYYNFKPITGVTMEEIEKAFTTLGGTRKSRTITGARFKEVMTTVGEVMDAEELGEAMRLLTGHALLSKAIPTDLTPTYFASDILGLDQREAWRW